MFRTFALGTGMLAGLILVTGCNQNTSSNQPPAGAPPASVAGNGNSAPAPNSGNVAVPPGELSGATQMFVQDAALDDMYEVQAGQIAAMRSQSPDIKQYAQQMVDAHTQNLNRLKQLIVKDAPAYKPPTQLDQTRQALLDDLQSASDQAIDPRYIAQQIDQHTQAMTLMRGYVKTGDAAEFNAFAQQTAPIVTMELREINVIERAHRGRVGAQANNIRPQRGR